MSGWARPFSGVPPSLSQALPPGAHSYLLKWRRWPRSSSRSLPLPSLSLSIALTRGRSVGRTGPTFTREGEGERRSEREIDLSKTAAHATAAERATVVIDRAQDMAALRVRGGRYT